MSRLSRVSNLAATTAAFLRTLVRDIALAPWPRAQIDPWRDPRMCAARRPVRENADFMLVAAGAATFPAGLCVYPEWGTLLAVVAVPLLVMGARRVARNAPRAVGFAFVSVTVAAAVFLRSMAAIAESVPRYT